MKNLIKYVGLTTIALTAIGVAVRADAKLKNKINSLESSVLILAEQVNHLS